MSPAPLARSTVIVIAAYNEERWISKVVSGLKQAGYRDIIVVDDGSRDATATKAKAAGATVIVRPKNGGKGAALRDGCDAAVSKGAEQLILFDGDGQHLPGDLPLLLRTARHADLVVGTRSFSQSMPFLMRLGNFFLSTAFLVLFWRRVPDTQSGLRVLNAKAYPSVRWVSSRYDVETEMLARAARSGLRIATAPITTVYHDPKKGTKPLDGFHVLARMLRLRCTRL